MPVNTILNQLLEKQDLTNTHILDELKTIRELLELQKIQYTYDKHQQTEKISPYTLTVLKTYTLDDYYQSNSISNPKYEYMRLFLSVAFDTGATSGVSADLYYNNTVIIEDILTIKRVADAVTGVSIPIDICNLSGFTVMFRNHDTKDVIIKNAYIVLYNKK